MGSKGLAVTWTIELPYTRPPLSLNDRFQTVAGRRAHSALVARVRSDTATLVRAARIPKQAAIHLRLHYRPGDKRRRDADNLTATLKPAIDGIVTAGVVPDDCAPYVDWSRPVIHAPVKGKDGALWLVIEAVAS